ncbi:hypothetical protein BOTCAL_0044g00050 [Botryotinia calthae]|uniref:Uncharacterized protein n=1 Tax=Botryotinia calthae TaxID=38488 RepID=A0A4Y8DBK7_9HELO|nr:hypothetical protein BOTCAL_0044g00050 [Botryotinia calthae]
MTLRIFYSGESRIPHIPVKAIISLTLNEQNQHQALPRTGINLIKNYKIFVEKNLLGNYSTTRKLTMCPSSSQPTANATTQKYATSTTYQIIVDSARQKKRDRSKSTKKDMIFEYKIHGGRTLEEGIKELGDGTNMVVLYKPAKQERE